MPSLPAWQPSQGQILLLRCALAAGPEEALGHWRALHARHSEVLQESAAIRLFPLVYHHFKDAYPEVPYFEQVKARYQMTWVQNNFLIKEMMPVLAALSEDGIPVMLLKGAALVQDLYENPGLRPMRDLDAVVPREYAAKAVLKVESLGWRLDSEMPRERIFRNLHGISFKRGESQLDLHWNVLWCSRAPGADDDFWKDSRPLSDPNTSIGVLCPEDQLIHLCAHGARTGRNAYSEAHRAYLQWIPDSVLLLRRYPSLDWTRLINQSRKRFLRLQVYEVLCFLKDVFGEPVPGAVLAEMGRKPFSYREKRHYLLTRWSSNPIYFKTVRNFWGRYEADYLQTSPLGYEPSLGALDLGFNFPGYLQKIYGADSSRAALARLIKNLFENPRRILN